MVERDWTFVFFFLGGRGGVITCVVACSLACYCFTEQTSQRFNVGLCIFASFGLYLLMLLPGCGVCWNINSSFTYSMMVTQHQMAAVLMGPPAVFDSFSLEELTANGRQLNVLRMTLPLAVSDP